MPHPHTDRLTPPTLRSLTMKVVLLMQRFNGFYCFNTRKLKVFDVDSLKYLPRTLSEELTSFSKLHGSFTAVDGTQSIWKMEKQDKSHSITPLDFYEFNWGGSYTLELDFEDYPYSAYFQPKRTRFYMDIRRKSYKNLCR